MAVSDISLSHLVPAVTGPRKRTASLGALVVLGSALVVPAALVKPGPVHDAGPGTSREQLLVAQDWVAAHPAAFQLTDVLIVLGLFCLAGFVRAVGVRANAGRPRPSRLLTWGSVLAVLGLTAAAVANAVISSVRVTLAQPTLDPQQAVDTYLRVADGWYFSPFFVPYLLLVPIGVVMVVAGLITSRTVPWWVAVLGLGFIAAIPFSPPPTALGVLGGGLVLTWVLGRRATRPAAAGPGPEPGQ